MRPTTLVHASWVAMVTWPLLACPHCDREGCDSLDERAARVGTGLGGVVAFLSDVVTDGCTECPLGETTIAIWRVDAPITTEAAAAAVAAREPDQLESVSGRYNLALAPASYLVCARPSCVAVDVAADETVTVNIELREGPPTFFVSRPNLDRLQETPGFAVGD